VPIICKHGFDAKSCFACQQVRETEPLRRDALRVTEEGRPALLLRTMGGSLNIKVLVLYGKTLRFETVKEISLRHPLTVIPFDQRKVLNLFLDLSLRTGYLFRPGPEITHGEQVKEGPQRCPFDHSELSLKKGSLGCTQCRTYVCQCGRCLCGYPGKTPPGQVFSPSPLIPREERLEYIRVVRFCDLNIPPVISPRRTRHLYLVRK
jgi:hypothetical protein